LGCACLGHRPMSDECCWHEPAHLALHRLSHQH
jgi:hypothetical protein